MLNNLRLFYKENNKLKEQDLRNFILDLTKKYKNVKLFVNDTKPYDLWFKVDKSLYEDEQNKIDIKDWKFIYVLPITWEQRVYIIFEKQEKLDKFMNDNMVCLDNECKNIVYETFLEVLLEILDWKYYKLEKITLNDEPVNKNIKNLFNEEVFVNKYWEYYYIDYNKYLNNFESVIRENKLTTVKIEFEAEDWKSRRIEVKSANKILNDIWKQNQPWYVPF